MPPLVYTSNQGTEVLEVVEASGGTAQLIPIDMAPPAGGMLALRYTLTFPIGELDYPAATVVHSDPLNIPLAGQTLVGAIYESPDPGDNALVFGPLTIQDAQGPGTAIVVGSVVNPTVGPVNGNPNVSIVVFAVEGLIIGTP